LKRLAARVRARRSLRTLLRTNDFDIVHVNGSSDHRLVLSAIRGLPRPPRIVLTKHNSKAISGLGHLLRARATDQVIAVCNHTLRQLQSSAYRRCRLATVHNGIDTAYFAPYPEDLRRIQRSRWAAHEASLLIGSNAGTGAYKGWMDLVEGLALLPETLRTRVRVVIAGKPASQEQTARIAELGLSDHVQFPGLLTDVRPMVAALDAGFVLSHQVETISFACREMMSMGKPVLVSDYAGLPENIEHGRHGWIVPARNREAIANALKRMLEERGSLIEMGFAARERALAEFGLDRFVGSTEDVYRALLSGDPTALPASFAGPGRAELGEAA
jgi:L-malate glycosyltransferase